MEKPTHIANMPMVTNGVPDWIRTNGLSLRRRPLYPTELRGHMELYFTLTVLRVSKVVAKAGVNFEKAVMRRRKCSRFMELCKIEPHLGRQLSYSVKPHEQAPILYIILNPKTFKTKKLAVQKRNFESVRRRFAGQIQIGLKKRQASEQLSCRIR